MLKDLGSRDSQFIEAVADIRRSLLEIAGVSEEEWTAVLLQGSGTYAVEAVLQTSSPRVGARVLVLANGAYGKRMVQVCQVAGIDCDVIRFAEILPVDLGKQSKRTLPQPFCYLPTKFSPSVSIDRQFLLKTSHREGDCPAELWSQVQHGVCRPL